ncbi:MAG: hypothetical protein M0R76_05490 [Proteobacteria bacterium]|nr:hypothetical protein [Pseudomonadota bacterium]
MNQDFSNLLSRFVRNINKERLAFLVQQENGFEGWLKHELAFFLSKEFKKKCSENSNEEITVKLEESYKFADSNDRVTWGSNRKIVDVTCSWGGEHHLIELKLIWQKYNQRKMAQSAGWDLWALQRLEKPPASVQVHKHLLVFIVADEASLDEVVGSSLDLIKENSGIREILVSEDIYISENTDVSKNKFVFGFRAVHIQPNLDAEEAQTLELQSIEGKSPSGRPRSLDIYPPENDKQAITLWIHTPNSANGMAIELNEDGLKRLADAIASRSE